MKKEYLVYKLSEDMKDCTRIDSELGAEYEPLSVDVNLSNT